MQPPGAIDIAEAVTLANAGRFVEALRLYDALLAADSDCAAARIGRALAHANAGDPQKALADLDGVIARNSRAPEAWFYRGRILRALGADADAAASFGNAARQRPDWREAQTELGAACLACGRWSDAAAAYTRAARLGPGSAELCNDLGAALQQAGRLAEARDAYGPAIRKRPDFAPGWANLGALLRREGRREDALRALDRATTLRPDHAESRYHQAVALAELGRLDQALAAFDCALALRPTFAEARFARALLLLRLGRYAEGFAEYEWRKRLPDPLGAPTLPRPEWLGQGDIAGRTILLHGEQGLGDIIQFARYAPMVEALGARVLLAVPASLVDLLRTLSPTIAVLSLHDALPPFDLHCPLMSLPLAFGTALDTAPAPAAYLRPDPALVTGWRPRLPSGRPRIGFTWAANSANPTAHSRTVGLAALLPLVGRDGSWVALQKDQAPTDARMLEAAGAANLGPAFRNFADTAAVVAQLDLVIAADSSVAHLAGALGTPVWVLVSPDSDWRWGTEGETTPWYPTARLFRQSQRGDWSDVVQAMMTDLTETPTLV